MRPLSHSARDSRLCRGPLLVSRVVDTYNRRQYRAGRLVRGLCIGWQLVLSGCTSSPIATKHRLDCKYWSMIHLLFNINTRWSSLLGQVKLDQHIHTVRVHDTKFLGPYLAFLLIMQINECPCLFQHVAITSNRVRPSAADIVLTCF
jgi:hypothetical protein